MFASAAVIQSEDFEGSSLWTGVTAAEYGKEETLAPLQYPFTATNATYGVLDDVATSPEAAGAKCFDMYVQFKPLTEEAELADGAKLAVYAGTDGMIHVLTTTGNYTTEGTVDADTWTRLTIVEAEGGYKVYAGEDGLLDADGINDNIFPAETGATTVEFTGSGKLDNFVARTTDPFYSGEYAASTGAGNEKYATYSDALADVLSSGATDAITIAGETPRTVDGTAANPYEITNLADLKALQAAVAASNGVDKCYLQTADIALDDAWPGIGIQNGKDIVSTAAFDNGAFTGTYDGGDCTVSNFQMVDGLDYCGFFNSVSNATIRNLKISYKDGSFAKDMVAAKEACGATFVGVAKGSTLQGLTSLAGTVSCTKGFGGIVGYLMAGSTVDSCTNNVNLTSTASNKCGGIAMITQGGSGTATISNCQNNGTTTGNASQKGGIVGYVGVATTIADCEDTAGSTPSILHNQGQTVTISGVITAPAGVLSYTTSNNNAIDGLDFATVDNDVATFVKAADLAAGNTYKVMGPKAKATYQLAAVGDTISFDTSLATPTYAITVANQNMFDVTSATEEDVTTYTAVGGTAVASITKDETTTQYNTVAKALAAAESGDTVVLLTDNTVAITIPAGVTVDCGEFANTGAIDGAGAIKLNAAPATAPAFGATWTGTCMVAWNPDSSDARINFNDLGNANSKVEIVGVNGAFIALPSTNWGTTGGNVPTILPEIVLSANWTVNNGWNTTTTLSKLSGTGNLTVNGKGNTGDPIPYTINSLDGYTGTLAGTRSKFTLGNIVVEGTPAFGDCLVKLNVGLYEPVLTSATVNGAAPAAPLCRDTLNDVSGVYLTAAQVVADDNSTIGYASVENALAAADAAFASTVNVLDANAEEVAATDWLYANGVYTSTREIATLNDTSYTSLVRALAAAQDGDTVTLVAATSEAVTIPAGVTVAVTDDVAFSGKLSGAGAIKYTKAPASFNAAWFVNWTGTFVVAWDATNANGEGLQFNTYGVEGSVVEIAGNFTGYAGAGSTVYAQVKPTVKVTGTYTPANGSSTTASVFKKVTGSGTINFAAGNKKYAIDALEDWSGTITCGNANCVLTNIVSGTGSVTYNYSAPQIWVGDDFSGSVTLAVAPQSAPAVSNESECEVVIGYNWSSNADLKWYGGSNSTIVVTSFTGNNTYFPATEKILSKVRVAEGGTVAINNGWNISLDNFAWDADRVVEIPALKVDGTFSLAYGQSQWNSDSYGAFYVKSLDASGAGSITVGNRFALRIDAVDFAEAPSGTDALVAMTLAGTGDTAGLLYGPNGVAGEQIPVTVNGVATEQTLVYDADKGGLVLYVAPTPKAAEVVDGEQYETLAEAIAAANAGDTVRLLSDATLAAMVTLEKNLTLDLNGHTLGNEGDTKSLFSIIKGATLTVNGSISTYCFGRFNVGAANTSGNLVLNNGYYMVGDEQTVIHVNGQCTASTVTVTGATIVSPTDNGVQFSGTGTYVLNNATVVGATAVYMKAGSLALNGTTSLNATGDKKAVTTNNNGSDATGDALVLDSCTPPYAAITGVTVAATVRFTSANGSAVLAYARTGNTRVTKVLPKNVTISEAVATESDLFVGGSIDPTAATKTTEVEAVSAAAAIEAVTVDVPRSIGTNTGVTAEQYKSYFKYVATPVEGKEGVFEVELVGLADDVQADADADAMDVLNGKAVAITMKPGLYYGVSAVTSLTDAGIATPQYSMLGGANGATTIDVEKPGTTRGFIKVWISTQTIQ